MFNVCRHFTGIGNGADGGRHTGEGRGACKAGVRYDDVCKQGKRMICLPCFPDEKASDKCSRKTEAELDAEEAEHEAHTKKFINQMMVARPAILVRYAKSGNFITRFRVTTDMYTLIARHRGRINDGP